jgi:phosphate transport system substrate-binding protein
MLMALSLFAAACGDDEEDDPVAAEDTETEEASSESEASEGSSESEPAGGSGELSGEVNVSGSSTVQPISVRVAELFEEVEPDVVVNVDGPGTGDGFELFCNGETDISDASRPIDEEEVAACEESGIEFIELKVAFDGISVLTNPANEAVTCLTFEDLYALVGPEAEGVTNWSDAQALATELGSTTELPDAPLEVVGPGEESGTYDSFIEIVFGDIAEAQLEAGAITEDQEETTAPTTSPRPTTTRSSRASRAATPPSGGSASPSPRRPARASRSSRSTVARGAWPPPTRPSPTAATRSPARCSST